MGIQSGGPAPELGFPIIDELGFQLLPNTPLPTSLSAIDQDCDFSNAPLLRYINEMLMEEDMEDQTHMLQESLDFQAKEKSFYEAIGKRYPPSPGPDPTRFVQSPDYDFSNPYSSSSSSSDCGGYLIDIVNSGRVSPFIGFDLGIHDIVGEPVKESDFRAKRNRHNVDNEPELENDERSSKIRSPGTDIDKLTGEFDSMLLNSMGEGQEKYSAYREELKNALKKDKPQPSRKAKKQSKKKEVIDLQALLISCAHAIAVDENRTANELLKKIREHSSPGGDASQRLAHYFADALEARLAGGRSPIYKLIAARKTKASDYLRAYYTSLASAPFKKISNFASICTIINESRKAHKVHVIDFGILCGFQWPTFIQRLAKRENGPPMVKITGIDFPQPGFRPAEQVEDTGRMLARYAEKFGVPFEYNAIARKWEDIRPEDLKIEKDEYLAVTCMYRGKNLPDESVMAESCPRTKVLDLIRKIKPDIFIHGVVNGTYGAPFFLTRFREVLYHFSALFDMLEACVPREITERTLIEKEMFGKEAFNVVACEGWERVERPETYKQWQVRNMRAGFEQVAFDREIRDAMEKVKMFFHKDFLIDEQSKWVLLGWRGRIVNAISCWKPV
ncbi:GRAS family transcription factor [Striga asiatica]|uniref:GRAS family transcription factor n=1 Tax=Striga asiatica TaxID=4170 RepID=A0A5A7P756_STRAF|nr:GRAS family transcription factor [Striga asiatica]